MTKSIKIIAAAFLLSSAAIGGAMAQSATSSDSPSNQGDYYHGIDRHSNMNRNDRVILPGVDGTATGSIRDNGRDNDRAFPTQDGSYYKGAEQPMEDPNGI
ncbi:hypothetical protein [Pararhizobium sp.]|uniref:hypothetical protein n=1 Tax=Pararhizobium sp. TaxID=1977563 RepID=UPI00271A14B1|nr:hypothetical protein [Pararhizobium sp.]MDO9418808.1 hypothetical protein [Pararhizobium sp.]